MTTKLTSSNVGSVKDFTVSWQSVITADGSTTTNVEAGKGYFIDTTSAAHTVTLPASASLGDIIHIKDYAGTFGTNNLTILRNGHNIQGITNDSLINTNRASVSLFYVDSTKGWLYRDESNVGDLVLPYIVATGGTETTSGDCGKKVPSAEQPRGKPDVAAGLSRVHLVELGSTALVCRHEPSSACPDETPVVP